jgi:predicted glycosyltransferase
MSKRVMFYSHDTFGLGHIRRTQKIANAISDGQKSILIACSSPLANSFSSKPGIEYLNLPGFAKQVSGEYLPRSMNIPLEEFTALRANLLLAAVKSFRPDMLIVDKEPLGVKGELLPTLRHVRDAGMPTRLVCGFRDILDEREKIEEEWTRKGVIKALGEFYDTLLVYGEKAHFDFEREYNLPEHLGRKVIHTGYVQPKESLEKEFFALDFPRDRPVVTFTLGGGGDGWEYIDKFLTMLEERLAGDDLNFVLLMGPFANQPLVERAKRLEAARTNVRVMGFTSNSIGLFERSRLVISMGGYNSVCELLHLRKYPLILPRVTPREEQLIRARVFKARGLCDFIHPADLSPISLSVKIRELVDFDRSAVPSFETNGIDNVSQFIEETLGCRAKSGSFLKAIHA